MTGTISAKAAESEAAQDALVRLGVDGRPLDAWMEMHLRCKGTLYP